jgi:hypothetical protein
MEVSVSGGLAQSGLGSAEFAATLDIVDAADLTESVDPAPLVSAYIKSVGAGAYGLSANRISESAAASFVRLAMRMSEAVRRSFFAPVDVRSRIAAAAEPDVNPYTIEDETARSLRAHIHILCRAVAGLKESSPKELTAALIELSERVPPAIRQQFDIARNAFIYSWFVYEFATLAEQQCFATLEMALRHRRDPCAAANTIRSPGLHRLIKSAVENGSPQPAVAIGAWRS